MSGTIQSILEIVTKVPLRRIFGVLRSTHNPTEPEIILATKLWPGMTIWVQRVVSVTIRFEALPTFQITDSDRTEQEERLDAMIEARDEIAKVIQEICLKTALKSLLPPSARYHISPSDYFIVFHEPSARWEGQFRLTRTTDKEIGITDGRTEKPFQQMSNHSRSWRIRQQRSTVGTDIHFYLLRFLAGITPIPVFPGCVWFSVGIVCSFIVIV